MQSLSIIAALGKRTRCIGNGPKLLWHIQKDMQRFKDKTKDHPVIMGRKTWESLPEDFKPLPGRTNIIITRQPGYVALGAVVVDSLNAAIAEATAAPGAEETFVIGGGEVYAEALPLAHTLYLTLVDSDKEGDVFFPAYDESLYQVTEHEKHTTDKGTDYEFVTLVRK